MTVDVATLVFDFRSESAAQAEKAMDQLIAKGDRLEATARKVRRATDFVNEGHRGAAGAAERATQAAMSLANAEGAVEKATRGAGRASNEVRAQRQLEAAAMRELVAATKAYERDQARAAAASVKAAREQAAAVAALRASVDPLAAAQDRVNAEMAQANTLYKAGAISAAEYQRSITVLNGRLGSIEKAHQSAAKGARLQAHELANLGFQAQDVFVSLASGQNALMVLVQQGSQISQILGSSRGGMVGGLKELGSIALSVLGKAGPLAVGAIVVGTLATAFIKGSDEAADFQNALTATGNAAGLTAGAYEDMAKSIADSTDTSIRSNKAAISQLVETGRFSAQTIQLMVEAAQRYSKLTGKSTQEILEDYASMADGVTKWAAKHAIAHHDLSVAQLARIEQLEKAGRAEDAYRLAMEGIKDSVENRAAPAYGFLQQLFHDTQKAASDMWDAILGVGRPATIEDKIADLQNKVDIRQKGGLGALSRYGLPGVFQGLRGQGFKDDLARDQDLLAALKLDKGYIDAQTKAQAAAERKEADEIRKRFLDPAGRTGRKPKFDASEQMIEQAAQAELQARMALTRNIEQTAAYRRQEVETELALQKQRTARALHEGSITKAAADQADASYGLVAATKKTLIDREEEAAIAQRALTQRQEMLSGQEKLAQLSADMAQNAAEASAIEMRALEERQALERDQLAERTRQGVIWGELTEAAAAELTIQQLAVQQAEKADAEHQAQAKILRERTELEEAALQNHIDLLSAQADLLQSAYARAVVEQDILRTQQQIERLKLEEVIASATSTATEKAIAQSRLDVLAQTQAAEMELAKRQTRLVNAIGEAASAASGFKSAFKRYDWAGVADNFVGGLQTILASFKNNGAGGGLMTAGAAAAQLVGGKTGRAIGNGIGIAGSAAALGSSLAFAGSMGALGSGLAASLAIQLAPLLGPIGLAAGALYAAAKIFNVGGKPTNAGAGYDLITGAISGNKRTDETEGAARSAGEAIQGIQDALKAAGIEAATAIRGVVIGTRDPSQIYTTDGRTLTSAKGDAGAAVDTALKALLEGATYVSDAQKKLVESALATGKGFDAVSEVLAQYEAAQKISGSLADEILKLTKPQQFDEEAVQRDIQAQRDAYAKLATEGYLTADQLATINTQLTTLEGLRLDEVMKRYADSVDGATIANQRRSLEIDLLEAMGESALAEQARRQDILAGLDPSLRALQVRVWAAADAMDALKAANDNVSTAQDTLRSAYERDAEALRSHAQEMEEVARSLASFRRDLDFGSIAGRDPASQYLATKREFDRLNALAVNDPERLANLQQVGQAFIDASREASPTQLAFDRDLNAVRRAVEASQLAAKAEADMARQQLDALTAQVGQLIQLNAGVVTVAQAIAGLKDAVVAQAVAQQAAKGGAVNDNFDPDRYLAANKDIAKYAAAHGLDPRAFATQHYQGTGQYEIAAGLRGYATGGSFTVGGAGGTDSQVVSFRATPGEQVHVRTPGQAAVDGGLAEEVRALRAELAAMRAAAESTASSNREMNDRDKQREYKGVYVRGQSPDDPVSVAA